MQQHDVFISYTQPDRNVASYMHDVIRHNNLSSWMAISTSNGIVTGKSFESQIVEAVRNSKVFVLIYSDYCNHSADVIREIRHRNKYHPTIIIRLDDAAFRSDLSFYLTGVQYISAVHNNLQPAANILLSDIRRIINGDTDENNRTTDKVLFYKGVDLVREKKYQEAVRFLQQYSEIAPDCSMAGFYLSLALIGGRKIRKMNGLQVRTLEGILSKGLYHNKNTGYINILLAIIKQGYYLENGFIVPEPGIETLIKGITLSPEWTADLLTHISEPEHEIWQQLLVKNNTP